jgi:hypothetical protein
MPDLTEINKEPESESFNKNTLQSKTADDTDARRNLIYSIIAGAIGGFLITLFWTIAMNSVGQNTDLNPIESLFLDAAIFEVFFDRASIFVFILTRTVVGGVFGYLAYLMFRRKKVSIVIFAAFLAGLFGGAIMLSCVVVLSVQ